MIPRGPYRTPEIPPPPRVPREALRVRVCRVVTPARYLAGLAACGFVAISVVADPWWIPCVVVAGAGLLGTMVYTLVTILENGNEWPCTKPPKRPVDRNYWSHY